jgi:hypothetical protein
MGKKKERVKNLGNFNRIIFFFYCFRYFVQWGPTGDNIKRKKVTNLSKVTNVTKHSTTSVILKEKFGVIPKDNTIHDIDYNHMSAEHSKLIRELGFPNFYNFYYKFISQMAW